MVKYHNSRIKQNKAVLSRFNFGAYKQPPIPQKAHTSKIYRIVDDIKSKYRTQNTTPNEKHRPQCPENATERPKTKTAYKNTHPQKEKASRSEKTPCKTKRKAAHDLNRERLYFISLVKFVYSILFLLGAGRRIF